MKAVARVAPAVKVTICGLLAAESTIVIWPLGHPKTSGLNVTPSEQVAPAARVPPGAGHVVALALVLSANGPLKRIELIVNADDWLLRRRMVLVGLIVLITSYPNAMLAGLTETGTSPVPVSGTVCGLLLALSVIVRVLDSAVADVGLKLSAIVQLAPAASVGVRHVDEGSIANGVPGVTARELIVRADV